MGIVRSQGPTGGVTFVDIKGKPQMYMDPDSKEEKHGAMVVTNRDKSKEVLPSNSAIEGYVTSFDVRTNEFQGEPISSLQVRIEDTNGKEQPVQMSVTLGSYFSAKIIGLFNAADLTQPVKFVLNSVKQGKKWGKICRQRQCIPYAPSRFWLHDSVGAGMGRQS